jgi:hypothetical protein
MPSAQRNALHPRVLFQGRGQVVESAIEFVEQGQDALCHFGARLLAIDRAFELDPTLVVEEVRALAA